MLMDSSINLANPAITHGKTVTLQKWIVQTTNLKVIPKPEEVGRSSTNQEIEEIQGP